MGMGSRYTPVTMWVLGAYQVATGIEPSACEQ